NRATRVRRSSSSGAGAVAPPVVMDGSSSCDRGLLWGSTVAPILADSLRRLGGARDDLDVTNECFARLLVRYTARVSKRVLIVEDDPEIIQLLQEFFTGLAHGHDYEVETATDGVKAVPLLRRTRSEERRVGKEVRLVDGLELLKKMRQNKIRV